MVKQAFDSSLSKSFFFFFFFNFIATLFIYLFYFWLCWVFGSCEGFLQLRQAGPLFIAVRGPLFIAVRGPLTIAAPPVAGHRLQTRKLSSCGSRAQPLRGTWDPPRPGLEPVSPALADRFSTTAPPGKPLSKSFLSSTSPTFPSCRALQMEWNAHEQRTKPGESRAALWKLGGEGSWLLSLPGGLRHLHRVELSVNTITEEMPGHKQDTCLDLQKHPVVPGS